MLLDTLNKILIVLFFLSCLNVIRHTYFFIQTGFYQVMNRQLSILLTVNLFFY